MLRTDAAMRKRRAILIEKERIAPERTTLTETDFQKPSGADRIRVT
jgi:hypothetical protein